MGRWLCVADGLAATPGMGHADRDAVLRRPRRADSHRRLPRVRLRSGQLRQITEDHTIGNLVADAGLLALVLARHLDGRPERSADTGLRDPRPATATCCALTDSARSQKTDRTLMY